MLSQPWLRDAGVQHRITLSLKNTHWELSKLLLAYITDSRLTFANHASYLLKETVAWSILSNESQRAWNLISWQRSTLNRTKSTALYRAAFLFRFWVLSIGQKLHIFPEEIFSLFYNTESFRSIRSRLLTASGKFRFSLSGNRKAMWIFFSLYLGKLLKELSRNA